MATLVGTVIDSPALFFSASGAFFHIVGDVISTDLSSQLRGFRSGLSAGRLNNVQQIKQSTADNVRFAMRSAATGDLLSGLAASITLAICKKGSTSHTTITPTITDVGSGLYDAALTSSHGDTIGVATIVATAPGALTNADIAIDVVAIDRNDAVRAGLSAIPNAAAGASGGLPTIDSSLNVSAKVATIVTDAITAAAVKADAVTKIQTGLATSAALTTLQTSATDIQGRIPTALDALGNIKAGVQAWLGTAAASPTVAGIPKVEVSSILAGAVTAIQAGLALAATALSTVQWTNGRATNLDNLARLDVASSTLATATAVASVQSDTDDIQSRLPAVLDGGFMKASVQSLVANSITAAAVATDAVTEIQTGLATSTALGTLQSSATDIQGRIPAALVSGRIASDVGSWLGTAAATPTVAGVPKVEVSSLAAGAITATVLAANCIGASQIATDAIDADSLKADAVAEIQSGLATSGAVASVQTDTTLIITRVDVATGTRASTTLVNAVGSAVVAVQADTDDIQTRLPTALVGGNMPASVQSLAGSAITAIVDAIFGFVEDSASPSGSRTFAERLRAKWSLLFGKATGLTITTASAEAFRDPGDTKNVAAFTLATDGTRTPGAIDGTP